MAEPLLPDPLTVAGLLPPYALSLGMAVDRIDNGVPVLALDFAEKVHGRPGFLHGGAIAGLLEMAAFAALRVELRRRGAPDSMAGARLKPVNISVEYLRGGTAQRTYAIGRVTRAVKS